MDPFITFILFETALLSSVLGWAAAFLLVEDIVRRRCAVRLPVARVYRR